MYYRLDRALSFNQVINIVLGGRGIGKTYAWKEKAIKDFLRYGKQFGYIRRYDTELNLVKDSLFKDILLSDIFPGIKIDLKGNEWFINDQLAGFAFALSKSKDYKSSSFPCVYNLLFDEFIIDGGRSGAGGYLTREPFKLLDLYETIARMRENVYLFMMANSLTLSNPYFLEWDLYPESQKTIYVKNGILVQLAETAEEFKVAKYQTRFGQIAKNLGYADYSIENKILLDVPNQIIKKGKNPRFYCIFVWKGENYGFWFDYDSGCYILSTDYDPLCKLKFTIDKDSITQTIEYLSNYRQHPYFKLLRNAFFNGTLRYETEKIQHSLKAMVALIY